MFLVKTMMFLVLKSDVKMVKTVVNDWLMKVFCLKSAGKLADIDGIRK